YEVIWLKALKKLHDKIFKNLKLEDIFVNDKAFYIIEEKASKIIVIDLKYAKEEEVEVRKIGNDLEVSYLNYKRRFKLADNISSRKISSFSLQDNKLRVVMDYD
ncbi:MAG: ArsA family ATPase, partial [Anaerococcus vaginalis]|nr:ArsA family ATPase [Anaerococcus vaginalis]